MEDPSDVESFRENKKQAEEMAELESEDHCINKHSEEEFMEVTKGKRERRNMSSKSKKRHQGEK